MSRLTVHFFMCSQTRSNAGYLSGVDGTDAPESMEPSWCFFLKELRLEPSLSEDGHICSEEHKKLKMMNRDYAGNCSSLVVRLYNKHLSG